MRKLKNESSKSYWILILPSFLNFFLFILFVIIFTRPWAKQNDISDTPSSNFDPYTYSCPPLKGEFLISEVELGNSFAGYTEKMICRSGYEPFPKSVQCLKKGEAFLEWSHLPVCISVQTQIDHFKNVYCEGNATMTTCQMTCESNYIPSEHQHYVCHSSPCQKWSLEGRRSKINAPKCIPCNDKCKEWNAKQEALKNCPCNSILLKSKGKSSFKTPSTFGLYRLEGLNDGRPHYVNKVILYELFYSNEYKWKISSLAYPFMTSLYFLTALRSEIFCPVEFNGEYTLKKFIDVAHGSELDNDSEISIECLDEKPNNTFSCPCKVYGFDYLLENATSEIPSEMKYIMNNYTLNAESEIAPWILSPVYDNQMKQSILVSTEGYFRVWYLQSNNDGPFAIGHVPGGVESPVCPDDERLAWIVKVQNSYGTYIKGNLLKVRCLD